MKTVVETLPAHKIVEFLESNSNMAIATSENNIPQCAHCFYVYDRENNFLIFKSKPETNHIRQAKLNPRVAGTIAPDKLNKSSIKGIQFSGNFIQPGEILTETVSRIYYNKFPFAKLFQGNIWLIELTEIKMTDNTLGFGKKIMWRKLHEKPDGSFP